MAAGSSETLAEQFSSTLYQPQNMIIAEEH
jgi:hypothetical protein